MNRSFGNLLRNRHFGTVAKSSYAWNKVPPMTKIVATIGPASEQLPMLQLVTAAGMRIMRINFSHATYEEADLRVTNLRQCPGVHQHGGGQSFNLRAVMLDTQGPEIRTGSFLGNVKNVQLDMGKEITVTADETFRTTQSVDKIWVSYQVLPETVEVGDCILLDDGAVELKVLQKMGNGKEIQCKVINTGTLGNKKGVNLPGALVQLPAMSDKDRQDIRWGIKNDIDFIAASFTRKASDITEIRDYVKTLMKEFNYPEDHPLPRIIAKIENTEALTNLDSILQETDAIMVARGDLGVEIPMETLTNVQKDMVDRCNQAGKPVIVATQMLESMQKNPRPTRAECTDVANAVLDGADCVMLSGESAQGNYPVQSVKMMRSIVDEVEAWSQKSNSNKKVAYVPEISNHFEGMASAVASSATNLKATCIVMLSQTGRTARYVAKFHPSVPIVCFVPTQKVGRLLQIHRGVHPVVVPGRDLSAANETDRFDTAIEHVISMGFCKKDDTVLFVSCDDASPKAGLSSGVSMKVVKVTKE